MPYRFPKRATKATLSGRRGVLQALIAVLVTVLLACGAGQSIRAAMSITADIKAEYGVDCKINVTGSGSSQRVEVVLLVPKDSKVEASREKVEEIVKRHIPEVAEVTVTEETQL